MKPMRILFALLLCLTLCLSLSPAAMAEDVKAPVISQQPRALTIAEGANGTLSVYAAGSALQYQWQYFEDGAWTDCTESGSHSSTLRLRGDPAIDGREYRCVVSNGGGSAESAPALVSIKFKAPTIKRQPQTVKAREDEDAELFIEVSGSDLHYRWQTQKVKSNVWTDCTEPGADTDTLHLKATAENKESKYRCIVSNRAGSFTSNTAYLMVKLRSEEAVEKVQELTRTKDYDEAIEYGEGYYEGTPMAERDPEMLRACVHAYVLKSEQLQGQSRRQEAEWLLADCCEKYAGTGEAVAEAEKAALALEAVLTRGEPLNGTCYHSSAKGGSCELTIENGDSPVLVKIENLDNPKSTVSVYIRAKQSVKFNIKDGRYQVKYATGSRWYSEKELFGVDTVYTKPETTMEFKTRKEGSYLYWTTYTLTLRPIADGNLTSLTISADDF